MKRKNVNGEDILKKLIPLMIDDPRSTNEYHRKYKKGNRKYESEKKNGDNMAIKRLELQAKQIFDDFEKIISTTRIF